METAVTGGEPSLHTVRNSSLLLILTLFSDNFVIARLALFHFFLLFMVFIIFVSYN